MKPVRMSFLFIALFSSGGVVHAADVARVNGVGIPEIKVEQLLKANPGLAGNPQARQAAITNLINTEVVLQVAKKKGFNKKSDVRAAIEAATRQILVNAVTASYLEERPVSDSAVKRRYDELLKNMPEEEYRVRHIMVGTQEEAERVLNKVEGSDRAFAEAARQSLDSTTAARAGEIGWVLPTALFPEVRVALAKAGKDKPVIVQLGQGWDVVELMDTRKAVAPNFPDIKDQIRVQLQNEAIQAYVNELRQQARIELAE